MVNMTDESFIFSAVSIIKLFTVGGAARGEVVSLDNERVILTIFVGFVGDNCIWSTFHTGGGTEGDSVGCVDL